MTSPERTRHPELCICPVVCKMEYSMVVAVSLCVLCVLTSQFGGILSSEQNQGCVQTICQENRELLRCPSTQILVTNVTSLAGEMDDVMLRHVRRTCMGKSTCDVNVLCKTRVDSARDVFYVCVEDTPDSKTCTGSAVKLRETHGFLQNPDYPAPGLFRACHWRIEPRARYAVHLTLFDLASVYRSQGRCDGGLHVSAYTCGWSKQPYSKLLCAGDSSSSSRGGGGEGSSEGEDGEQEVTLVSCGPVDVRLTPARHSYPLRFWLGYSVKRSEVLGSSLSEAGLVAPCPESAVPVPSGGAGSAVTPLSSTMTISLNQSVTSASGGSDEGGSGQQDSTMTVLIVLVCVIGFIALVLTVVLVIVCLRRRRPKVELIEHVYAVPSACQTLSHNYIGDVPPPEPAPRPRLVQAYSDVADARSPDQPPQVTPASPAYAEVEEVCDVDVHDKTKRMFHFRFRKRPSVSSTGGQSTLYEDVNPVPVNSANTAKSNTAASKHNTLPKYSGGSKVNSAQVGPYSTGVKTKVGKGVGDTPANKTSKTTRESPVYVHVVDSADVKSSDATKPSLASKTASDKSSVAPLAAKFIANIDKSTETKVGAGARGKTNANSARLYPLQEGRVATLVSTLDRKKNRELKDTKNGVTSKEQNKVS